MHSFNRRQRSVRYSFSHAFIGGLALFGCSGHDLEPGACSDGKCPVPSAGGSGSWAGNGSQAGGASGGGGGDSMAGTSASGAGGPAAGSSSFGGNPALTGGTGGHGAAGAIGGAAGGPPKLCVDGAFDHDQDPSTLCKGWSRCAPGQFILQEGTDTADRVCALCPTASYSSTQNAKTCSPWTECGPNSYLTQVGSATTNQKCSPCPSAPSSQANQCFPEGACLFAGACQPGSVQTAPASASAPAQCTACNPGDYCIGGLTPQVRCASGSWDHDADPATCCAAWLNCAAGNYVSKSGSATENRECSSCAPGSFSQSSNAASCSAWKACPPAASSWPQGGVASAGTATGDAVCADPYYRFGTTAGDAAFAVAVDASGNVYVAGYTYGALAGPNAGASDPFVRKLDAQGTVIWTQQQGVLTDEQANGIAVDSSGNVYFTARTWGGSSNGGFVRKLNASGATLWTQRFGDSDQTPAAVAVDLSGNAYVAGTFYPNGQASGDAFVRKFDPSGAVVWTQQFGGPDEDGAMTVAVDASGNAYVGGNTYGLASNEGQHDGFVRKFDTSGATLWTRQFGTSESDQVSAARVDSSGNLYVAGNSSGGLGGSNTGTTDTYVRKFDASGTMLWTKQVATSGYEYCTGLALDGSNNVYVVGSTDNAFAGTNAGKFDAYVRKLDPSGATLWSKQVGTSSDDSAQGAAADASGNLYLVGSKGDFDQGDAFVWHVPAQSP